MTHGSSASKVAGRYSFLTQNKLKIDISGSPRPMILLVSIKGDQMTLKDNNLPPLTLHRVAPSQIKPEISAEEEMRRYLEQSARAATNHLPR